MILVGQSIGHPSHHLLPGSLHLGREFLAEVTGQNNNQHITQELLEERQNKQIGALNAGSEKNARKTKIILSLYSNTFRNQTPHSVISDKHRFNFAIVLPLTTLCLISHTFSSFHYIHLPLLLLFPFTSCLISANTKFLCYSFSWWRFKSITKTGTSLHLSQYSLWNLTHFYNIDEEIPSLNCIPNLFFNINY